MRHSIIFAAVLPLCLLALGCNSGIGNPFEGALWTVGANHVSFNYGVAERDTAGNKLTLKFSLLSGASYPDGFVTVEGLTTLLVNQPREVATHIAISASESYDSKSSDPGAIATVTFTQLDFGASGAVSGTVTGKTRSIEHPEDAPVDFEVTFTDVPVI